MSNTYNLLVKSFNAIYYHIRIWSSIDTNLFNWVYDGDRLVDTFQVLQGLLNNHTYYIMLQSASLCGYGIGSQLYPFNTCPVGINQISNEIPSNFELFQNYPNPFNPTTVIKYQLTMNGYVKLIIYDITGKEVITLVNENQSAGTYEIEWSASNYPSGIYFYKLSAENYSNVKKMVLIK